MRRASTPSTFDPPSRKKAVNSTLNAERNLENYSDFEKTRLKIATTIPAILAGKFALKRGEKTSAVGNADQIEKLFPKLFGQETVEFVSADVAEHTLHQPMNIGCVLSGGQASGGHNCIVGLFDYVQQKAPGSKIFGFIGGPMGIMKNRHRILDAEYVDKYRNTGGFDMLTAGRDKIESEDNFQEARNTAIVNNLDGLVVIGGDDSNTNAALIGENFKQNDLKCKVLGLPKTIDGDLKNEYVETSFGFDTAAKLFSECVGNIQTDCVSTGKYYHFIRLMGREASHLTLETALQCRPNMTFIGEEVRAKGLSLHDLTDSLCDMVCKRAKSGKNHGIVVIPEGLIDFVPEVSALIADINEVLAKDIAPADVATNLAAANKAVFDYLPSAIQDQLLLDRDPHGNVQVAKIESERLFSLLAQKELVKRQAAGEYTGKFAVQAHYFGYEGRCTPPTDFDCNYCHALGLVAGALIGHGHTGMMACIRGLYKPVEEWQVTGMPLTHMMNVERRKGKDKPVIKKALVELEGAPFKAFCLVRDDWQLEDRYRNPGPTQYGAGIDVATYTLRLEQQGVDAVMPFITEDASLAKVRRTYQPALPDILQDITQTELFTNEVPPGDALILQGMKRTGRRPLVEFRTGTGGAPIQKKTLKIGVVFSGRQTPGGHTAIGGICKFCELHGGAGSKVLGFVAGTKGLFSGDVKEITPEVLSKYMNLGGFDMLGRTADVIRGSEQIQQVAKTCTDLDLDGLCILGGTISMCDSGLLAEELLALGCKTKVIGLPATIDGDLKSEYLEACIGYDTACRVYASLIGHLQTDAASAAKYYYFVRVMGREASQIVLECGMQNQPNMVLIGEELEGSRKTLFDVVKDLADMVEERFADKKNFGVVLIPEGLVNYVPELHSLLREVAKAYAEGVPKDQVVGKLSPWSAAVLASLPESIRGDFLLEPESSTGTAQLNQIETERLLGELVSEEMSRRKASPDSDYSGSFSPVSFYLGYQARSSMPSNFDCNLAYSFGCTAGALVAADNITTGYMTTMSGLTGPPSTWRPGGVPISALMSIGRRAGHNVAVLPPTPVDLSSGAFLQFKDTRAEWRVGDCFRNPGPLQFSGPTADSLGQLLVADHAKTEQQRTQVQELLELLREQVLGSQGSPGVLDAAVSGLSSLTEILSVVHRTESIAKGASQAKTRIAFAGGKAGVAGLDNAALAK